MTTKTLHLGELLTRATTPRGKRKPFSGIGSLNDRLAYLQHGVAQVVMAMEHADVVPPQEFEEDCRARTQEMVDAFIADHESVTFDESDIEQAYDDGIDALAPLAEQVKIKAERDQADAKVAAFQWYFVSAAGEQPKPEAETEVDEIEGPDIVAAAEQVASEMIAESQSDQGEAEGEPEELPDWHAPRPNLDGDEVIRLAGIDYIRHPLSAAFADLDDDEIAMLADSIKTRGQEMLVVIDMETGRVVDGWQRLRAMVTIEQEPATIAKPLIDPSAYVMAVNEHRRGSSAPTVTQRCIKAMELLDIQREGEGGRRPSAKVVAATAGCSTGTVEQIRRAMKWDKTHGTNYFERMERGSIPAAQVNREIAAAEERAKQAEAGEAPEDDAPEQPKQTGVEYDINGNKKSRRDLIDELTGALEDEQIAKEQHAQAIAGERTKVAEARKAEQKAREDLERYKNTDESAKREASLEEQNAALKSQVETLSQSISELQRERNIAVERLERAEAALIDGDRDELYDALDVPMPEDLGDEGEVFA